MFLSFSKFRMAAVIFAAIALGFASVWFVNPANATHSWNGYHWARTANPFTLKLGNSMSFSWNSYLVTAANDWSLSGVLDTLIISGARTKNCKPVLGRAEACNAKYGRNGWLGIASIWASGSHITQGTVKMNDTYFSASSYNTPAWKNLVLCQEIGHVLGLDHQDENFDNSPLGTCMDYSRDPSLNQHPDQHDYDMLETIYAHLDTTTTLSQSAQRSAGNDIDFNDPKEWGREIKKSRDGKVSLHERDLGKGHKVFTFVFWAEGNAKHK